MTAPSHSFFRLLPSTDVILQELLRQGDPFLSVLPRPMMRDLVNAFLETCRARIKEGAICSAEELEFSVLLPAVLLFVQQHGQPHFRRVLNATGVVIHTNLGRSLLAPEAVQAVSEAGACYSNLEFNLATGQRGSRYSHVEELLCMLTGAEAALVVNNNAAAVLLVLDTVCKGHEVIVSRGELVEIGGSFRIPEVMEKSGCTLKEVGATNRTHLDDYRKAINEHTAALMKVHTSNFRIVGFTKEVARAELVQLAREYNLPAIEDLGSGSLMNWQQWGIPVLGTEPTVQDVVAAGMDVVSFSGDKVLGGPQAGILVGKKAMIDRMKANPLNRALRIDKLTLAALEATLRLYTDPELAIRRIPTLRMLSMNSAEIKREAGKLLRALKTAFAGTASGLSFSLRQGVSRVGGGAFPECDLPTWLVAVEGRDPELLREALLNTRLPLVGRIEDNAFCLDLRTLQQGELPLVVAGIAEVTG